jgi:HD-GYP domain-containing protein (c-di-GMP phosphodiesterase class II)
MAGDIVLCHEERFDGSGYPSGLRGEAIPLPARLFAVIDTLDAMSFDRPYRKALPFDVAKTEIVRMSGSQFDPLAVDIFLKEEEQLRELESLAFPIA